MEFVNPSPIALWRKRKSSRTAWRTSHALKGKRRVTHGGRGRKYGIKGRKNTHRA